MKPIVKLIAAALLGASLQPALAEQPAANTAPAADMQQQMKLMQSQMAQIAKTQDPKEKQRLLEEHMAAMQKMLASMQGAAGGCISMHPMMDQMAQHQHWMMMMQPPAAPAAPSK